METGMLVSVFSAERDCTNGGLTSKYSQFVLLGMEGPFKSGTDAPPLELVRRYVGGREHLHAQPVKGPDWPRNMCGPMFGGNFIFTSDSRFSDVSPYPIPVHDRFETQEEADLLSK